jgi:phthalate 4,5-cis-dihydrodiol dehydrogenase
MADLGAAVVGTGNIARAVGRAIDAVPGIRLIAAADVRVDRAQAFTSQFGGEAHDDYRRMIRRDDVEVVFVTLPTGLHADPVVEIARAGKHIYVEKPMAMTVAECDRMIEAVERAGVHLLVAQTEEFITPNLEAKRIIARGEVGAPVLATDTWNKAFLFASRQDWFLDGPRGGGMWYQNGSHMIDRVSFILDSPVVAVKAMVGTHYHPMTAPDSNLAYLQLANGVPCVLVQANYRDQPDGGVEKHEIEFACQDAMLKIAHRRELAISRGGRYEEIALENQAPFEAEVRALIETVTRGVPLPITPERGRHIVAVLEAGLESSRTGREIRLAD